jgi:sec-independent protein translocase protein TatA
MVGLDNPLHLGLLLVVLLLIFGAKRLPEMGRSLGSGLRGFKESLSGQTALQTEDEPAAKHKIEVPEAVELPDLIPEGTKTRVADELETRTAA